MNFPILWNAGNFFLINFYMTLLISFTDELIHCNLMGIVFLFNV